MCMCGSVEKESRGENRLTQVHLEGWPLNLYVCVGVYVGVHVDVTVSLWFTRVSFQFAPCRNSSLTSWSEFCANTTATAGRWPRVPRSPASNSASRQRTSTSPTAPTSSFFSCTPSTRTSRSVWGGVIRSGIVVCNWSARGVIKYSRTPGPRLEHFHAFMIQ